MTVRKSSCLVLQIILVCWNCTATGQQLPVAPRRGASAQSIPKPNMTPHAAVPTPETVTSATLKNFERFAKRRTPGQLSSANPNDHEDAGILNDGGGTFTERNTTLRSQFIVKQSHGSGLHDAQSCSDG